MAVTTGLHRATFLNVLDLRVKMRNSCGFSAKIQLPSIAPKNFNVASETFHVNVTKKKLAKNTITQRFNNDVCL